MMARFIDVQYWKGDGWAPMILNTDLIETVELAQEHNERPACIVATLADCNGDRGIYLNLTWDQARGAFAAISP